MKRTASFNSSQFPKYPKEDEETINPNRWGKRLAEWLRTELSKDNIESDDLFPEDWGWVISIKNDVFPLWIGCGIVDETEDEFIIFVEAEPGFLKQLFKKVDTKSRVEKINSALDKILKNNSEIKNLNWTPTD